MKKLLLILLLGSGFTAFSQDSTNTFEYNYRKGMVHYNNGVDIINKLNGDLPDIDTVNVKVRTQFEAALPFLLKAYSIKPKDENILKALQGVYFSLYDQEKSDRYKKELEALKK